MIAINAWDEYLNMDKSCEILGVSWSTLKRWADAGRIPYVLVKKHLIFKRTDVFYLMYTILEEGRKKDEQRQDVSSI